jgi:large subunit ribosomal protein L22
MEVKASATYLKVSPRKLRLLTRGLRGLSPQRALKRLEFYPQKGRVFLQKVIKQGVANAKQNYKLTEESLVIKTIEVNEGPRFKRYDKSHGARFDRGVIRKRTSHLLLTLEEKASGKVQESKEGEKMVEKERKAVKAEATRPKKASAKKKEKTVTKSQEKTKVKRSKK